MIHYNPSPTQLEGKAIELIKMFDEERLVKTKPIDVYAVIEKCLGVEYTWKYLSPDQSILGMTAFKPGYIWVWPEPYYEEGMLPSQYPLSEGMIVIDSTLTEPGNEPRENFTVMHEVFHQFMQKRCFLRGNPDYSHWTTREALNYGGRRKMNSLEICEYQANYCAAAFLMPKELLTDTVRRYKFGMLDFRFYADYALAKDLAEEFSVSAQAMKIRLQTLGLAAR